jgi:hypothetical protein
VKKPGKGIGEGSKRWDLKIYAANGLMRVGAWSAAWREMERCDVEITPWIPTDVRKALEKKIEEEEEVKKQKLLYEAEVQRLVEAETARLKKLESEAEEKRKQEEEALRKKVEEEEAERQRRIDEDVAEKKKLQDALQGRLEEMKESMRVEFELQALSEAESVAQRFRLLEEKLANAEARTAPQIPDPAPDTASPPSQARRQSRGRPRSVSRSPVQEIPLGTLLRNYFVILARDQRNMALIMLSVVVCYLAMQMNVNQNLSLPSSGLPRMLPDDYALDSASPIAVTATATTTATVMSTTTVTQFEKLLSSASASPIPSPATEGPDAARIAPSSSAETSTVPSPVASQEALESSVAFEEASSHVVNEPTSSEAATLSANTEAPSASETLRQSNTEILEEQASYSTSTSTAPEDSVETSEASTSFASMPISRPDSFTNIVNSRSDNPLASSLESIPSEAEVPPTPSASA